MMPSLQILQGDCLEMLKTLPGESVHVCISSPPYRQLRDYQIQGQIGLEPTVEEYISKLVAVYREVRRVLRKDGTCWVNLGSSYFGGTPGSGGKTSKQITNAGSFFDGKPPIRSRSDAPACGSDGKEPQGSQVADRVCPDSCDESQAGTLSRRDNTAHNVQSASPIERLPSRKDHDNERTDCVSSSPSASTPGVQASTILSSSLNAPDVDVMPTVSERLSIEAKAASDVPEFACKTAAPFETNSSAIGAQACAEDQNNIGGIAEIDGALDGHTSDKEPVALTCLYSTIRSMKFKPKDMVAIPWLFALAMQADGWYLRQDIIWSKMNPMPESVTDRTTKAHEYLFLLSKSATYFYDAEAIKEIGAGRELFGNSRSKGPCDQRQDNDRQDMTPTETRNKRSVWTIPSQAYPDSHFATYPEDLVKPCILAGTSARGCCPKCGAPWKRQLERVFVGSYHDHKQDGVAYGLRQNGKGPANDYVPPKTTGWTPTCSCDCPSTVPCTVLDIFGGSCTTGQVALELGRNAVLIELNPDYVALGRKRCHVTPSLPLA